MSGISFFRLRASYLISIICWDMKSCSLVRAYQLFGIKYCPQLEVRRHFVPNLVDLVLIVTALNISDPSFILTCSFLLVFHSPQEFLTKFCMHLLSLQCVLRALSKCISRPRWGPLEQRSGSESCPYSIHVWISNVTQCPVFVACPSSLILPTWTIQHIDHFAARPVIEVEDHDGGLFCFTLINISKDFRFTSWSSADVGKCTILTQALIVEILLFIVAITTTTTTTTTICDCLCDLVARVSAYRSRSPGSILGTIRFSE
jgi:hypothetical protein